MTTAPPFPSPTKAWHNTSYAAISPKRSELSAKGKTIVVSGGGSGIGKAIARSFAVAGAAHIIILGRTERTLQNTAEAIRTEFPSIKIVYHIADVVNGAAIERAFSSIRSVFGLVDVLVANAGYLPNLLPIKDASAEDWMRGYEVNIRGALNLTQAFLRTASEHATLINVSSGISHIPPLPGFSSYSSSKIAAVKLFDYIQAENPDLKVINLHPGVVETDMHAKSMTAGVDFAIDDVSLPADFTVWLASPEAAFLKGQYVWSNWDVDELKALKEEIANTGILTIGLSGWPFQK